MWGFHVAVYEGPAPGQHKLELVLVKAALDPIERNSLSDFPVDGYYAHFWLFNPYPHIALDSLRNSFIAIGSCLGVDLLSHRNMCYLKF